jgi:hypothetical protein
MSVKDIVSTIVVVGFFGYFLWTMKKTDKTFDNPERDAQYERSVRAAEKQADALDRLSRTLG